MKISSPRFLALLSATALLVLAEVPSTHAISPLRQAIPSSTTKKTTATIVTGIRGGALVEQPIAMVHQKKATSKAVKKKTSSSSSSSSSNQATAAILGSIAMAMVERGVKKVFVKNDISFPAQLAGCIVLFFALLMMDLIIPGSGESLYKALGPGTALLTKWLPVFFVPGLAMLPLAPSVGSGMEIAKILLITGLGFVYSLYTVAYSVLFLRKAGGQVAAPSKKKAIVKRNKKAAAPAKAYSDDTMALLIQATIASGVASVLVQTVLDKGDEIYAVPLKTFFFFCTTCATYVWGARLPAGFTKAVHPLITSTALTWGVLYWYGLVTGMGDFVDMVKSYKTGSMELGVAGAGDVLLFLLGPSVVSFAVSMYSRKKLLKENFLIVVASMLVSSLGALFGTAAFSKLIQLGSTSGNALMLRLSMLARNVTTALAIPITQILGGDVAIAVVVVVLTGIIGAQYGRPLLDSAGIQDPVTRGLAVGSSAQGLGVSSMVPEPDAFPFAAMAMTLTAVAGVVFVSVPEIKDALVKLCT